MQWKSSPQAELSGVAAKRYHVPIVVVEVVARVAAATAVGVGRHIGPTVGVVVADIG